MAHCLPPDVLERIFIYLSPTDVQSCLNVCYHWHLVTEAYLQSRHRRFVHGLQHCQGLRWRLLDPSNAVCACPRANSTLQPNFHPDILNHLSRNAFIHRDPRTGPSIRTECSFVYCRQALYVFGGCTPSATRYNDVWRFDLHHHTWEKLLVSGCPPSPRSNSACLVYGKYIVVFGGLIQIRMNPTSCDHDGRLFLLDTQSLQWLQVNLHTQPGPRHNYEEEEAALPTAWRHLCVSVEDGVFPVLLSHAQRSTEESFMPEAPSIGVMQAPTGCLQLELPHGLTNSPQWHSAWLRHICNQIGKSVCLLRHKWMLIYGGVTLVTVWHGKCPRSATAARQHAGIGMVDLSSGQFSYHLVQGGVPSIRWNHCSVAVGHDKMLVFGGQSFDGSPCTDYWLLCSVEDEMTGMIKWTWHPVQCNESPYRGLSSSCPQSVLMGQSAALKESVASQLGKSVSAVTPPLVLCLCTENDALLRLRQPEYLAQSQQTFNRQVQPAQLLHRHSDTSESSRLSARRTSLRQPLRNAMRTWPLHKAGLCLYALNLANLDDPVPSVRWLQRQPSPCILLPDYWQNCFLAASDTGTELYLLTSLDPSGFMPGGGGGTDRVGLQPQEFPRRRQQPVHSTEEDNPPEMQICCLSVKD